MRKTFCDRDGRECESRTGHLHLAVIQQTNKGEVVSEDEYRPMDLCGPCIDELVNTFLGGKIALHYNTKADMAMSEETAMAAPVRDEPRISTPPELPLRLR